MTVVIKPPVVKVAAEAPQGSVVIKPQQVEIVAKPDKVNIDIGNPIIREIVGGETYEGEYNVTQAAAQQAPQVRRAHSRRLPLRLQIIKRISFVKQDSNFFLKYQGKFFRENQY